MLNSNALKNNGKLSVYAALAVILLSSSALTSCQHLKGEQYTEGDVVVQDPFESTNRMMMSFNTAVDKALIHPVIKGYRAVTPQPVRSGLRNFLRNLRSPITFANQLLQGDLDGAGDVLVRTAVNTTVGVGGIFDVAGYEGIKYEPEDFGQTLATWGVPHGPYLVVPFIGPSSMRDYGGYFVDSMADPLRMYLHNIDEDHIYYTKVGLDYLDIRDSVMDSLVELQASSIDYYASVRSAYYQHRAALVNDQEGTATSSIPAIPNYDSGDE